MRGFEGKVKTMKKIVIATSSFGKFDDKPLQILKDNKIIPVLNPYGRKLEKNEVINLCEDAVGLISGIETLDADTLSHLTGLKVISRCGIGLDNIDVEAAKKLGIRVFNTPDAPTLAVAELSLALILNILRKINRMDRLVREGKWEKMMGNLLYKKQVGIVGFGRIGQKVAELLKPFCCRIAYTDPYIGDGVMGLPRLPLAELLKTSDIVTMHVSGKERILGGKELALMKKGAWLVNASRGEVVDEEALFEALKQSRLSGAAIDVFAHEPYSGELRGLDNVVLTPHIGSYAIEARGIMEVEAVNNLLKGLGDG